jgi:regulator of ribonuclease activity A
MEFKTADLCDRFSDEIWVAEPLLRDFGRLDTFAGRVVTLDVYEDSGLIQEALDEAGNGRVLVVDGGGSLRRALLGGRLAQLALDNDWKGIVMHGCVRHVARLSQMSMGIKALDAVPLASLSRGRGDRSRPVHFAGVTFRSGYYLFADADGIVVAPRNLLDEA